MKVIIAGTRTFEDYQKLRKECDEALINKKAIEIVSGRAPGADQLGERYAKERGYPVKPFPADWSKYGKRAGFLRNKQMAEYAEMLLAFWDSKSHGTQNMIELAMFHKLEVIIFQYSK